MRDFARFGDTDIRNAARWTRAAFFQPLAAPTGLTAQVPCQWESATRLRKGCSVTATDSWRSKVPAYGESNKWFDWIAAASAPEGGIHVPTEVGCDLISAELLPFNSEAQALRDFFEKNPRASRMTDPSASGFQAVNMLVSIWPIGMTRARLNRVFAEWLPKADSRFRPSTDPIQLVNKVTQRGIQDLRSDCKVIGQGSLVVYRIPVPIQFTDAHLSVRTGGAVTEPEAKVAATKEWLRKTFLDVPFEQWQLGHQNPELPDSDSSNVVLQPPAYNAPFRDRFIFDDRGLILCPTPSEFAARVRKYVVTEAGARLILEALLQEYPGLRAEFMRVGDLKRSGG